MSYPPTRHLKSVENRADSDKVNLFDIDDFEEEGNPPGTNVVPVAYPFLFQILTHL